MKKIIRTNKTQGFKFNYKDLIQPPSLGAGQGMVLFFGGLLAKSAWSLHRDASLVAGGVLASHKLAPTHAQPDVAEQHPASDNAAQQLGDQLAASTRGLLDVQASPIAQTMQDMTDEAISTDWSAGDGIQVAANNTTYTPDAWAAGPAPEVQLTVDLSDLTLGTPERLATTNAPPMDFLPAAPVAALDMSEFYLKFLGLAVGGGGSGVWADFAAGVVSSASSTTSYGGYVVDGAVYNSVVYRYDSAKSSSNYTDIFGDGSVYDYVWGGSAGLRYTTTAGAYLALPTSGGSGGAIKVMAGTSSYDMGWDPSKLYGFNTPLIMTSPYDTGKSQVVNPFTTLIQGLIDNDSTLSVATAANRVSTAFGLSSYYSSLGITSDSKLLYFDPLNYTSSSVSATKAAAIAMQAKAIEIVATISGGTQAVLAQNSNMDEVSVTKAILSSLVSYVGSNYAAGVDLSSSTVISSLLSSVTATSSSGSSKTVYLTDQALSTIATVNDNLYLTSSTTTLAGAYATQLQLMKNTDYTEAAFKAISNIVSYAASGDTILSLSFSSTSVGKSVNGFMTSLVADPTIKINLSSISSYTSGDSLVVSDLTNTYEHYFSSSELRAGIAAGYLTFNLSDLASSGTSLSLSELESFVLKAYLNKSGTTVDGYGYLAFMENTKGATLGLITETNGYGLTTTGQLTSTPTAASTLTGTYGTLAIKASGAWTYTSTDARNSLKAGKLDTTETFSVLTSSGSYETVTVTYLGTNDIPLISGTKTASLTEDSSTTVASGTLSIVDADTGESSFATPSTSSLSGTYGTFTFNSGAWTYTLDNTKSAVQALASGSTATDTLTVYSTDGTASKTITVTVTGANDAPTITTTTATDLVGAVTEDTSVVSSKLGDTGVVTFTDVDLTDAHTVTAVASSSNTLGGTLTMGTVSESSTTAAGTVGWTYSLSNSAAQYLAAGQTATETFTVTVADGYGGSVTQDVTVVVTGANDVPTITGTSTGSVTEGGTATASGTLTVTDTDTGESVFATPSSLTGTYGTFTFNATTGLWGYTLTSLTLGAGSTSTDSLVVYSTDGTAYSTISISVTGTNDVPTIGGTSTGSVTEDIATVASGTLTISDSDTGESSFATPSTSSLSGTYGAFTFSSGYWTYTVDSTKSAVQALASGSTATDTLTVYSYDGTASKTITATVTGVNDVPTISGTNTGSVTEDSSTVASGTLTISDTDTSQSSFATPSTSSLSGTYGTFTFSSGAWTYTVNSVLAAVQALGLGKTATDTLTVYSYDGTASKTITATVAGVNDVPTISGTSTGSVTEDSSTIASGTLTVTDTDTSQSVFASPTTASLTGSYGAFTFSASTGYWTYTVDSTKSAVQALASGSTATDTLTVYSYDGTASKTITATVNGANDIPTISGTNTGSVTEDSATVASGTLTISDTDTSQSSFASPSTSSLSGTYGTFTFSSGAWTYTVDSTKSAVQALASGATATDTLTVYSFDGTASKTITATVTGVNDVPTISGTSTGSLTEDSSTTVASGTLTISDTDTGQSSFATPSTSSLSGTYGTFTFSSGAWTYTVDNTKTAVQALAFGSTATDTLTVYSYDGTASKTITATVTGVNDIPTITGTSAGSVTEDSSTIASGTLTVTDTDTSQSVFASPSTSSLTGSYGAFTFNATTGYWTYTVDNTKTAVQALASGVTATDTLTVYSYDGTAYKTITATINGVNDATTSISGTSTGSVTEDSSTIASGTLSVADTDAGESVFSTTTPSLAGSYGAFTFNATSGYWTYTVDSTKSAVQVLALGATATDTLTVYSYDGTVSKTITATVTGVNDVPVMSSSNASTKYLYQGAVGSSLTTVSASDIDTGDSVVSYALSRQNGDADASYFTVNSSTGEVTYSLAGAISSAVDAVDVYNNTTGASGADGLMDTPYSIHVIATDTYGGYSTQAIAVNVYMAVSSSTDTSASVPYTSSSWSFAPHTTTDSNGDTVSDGFNLTNTTYSGIYLSLSDTVTSVAFTSGSLALSNDGSTGTITDTSSSGNSISITSGTVENTLMKVLAASTQTITGTTDSEADTGFGALTNYRDDTLKITDAAFSASTFSMSGDNLLITMATGGVKTVTEVEAVMFNDGTTVRVVGASGYASFKEALDLNATNQHTNTSHANVGDYIYGSSAKGYTPTASDLTHLTAVSGLTDFYTYHA